MGDRGDDGIAVVSVGVVGAEGVCCCARREIDIVLYSITVFNTVYMFCKIILIYHELSNLSFLSNII